MTLIAMPGRPFDLRINAGLASGAVIQALNELQFLLQSRDLKPRGATWKPPRIDLLPRLRIEALRDLQLLELPK